jgi:hypothetical protein
VLDPVRLGELVEVADGAEDCEEIQLREAVPQDELETVERGELVKEGDPDEDLLGAGEGDPVLQCDSVGVYVMDTVMVDEAVTDSVEVNDFWGDLLALPDLEGEFVYDEEGV